MSEFEDENYKTFNEFFIRKFKEGRRPFNSDSRYLCAPCEGRYHGIQHLTPETKVPVKGQFLSPLGLIGKYDLSEQFVGGPMIISRLAPIDYHRFHFPCDGKIIDKYDISGDLFSVNPLCLKWKQDTFLRNYRRIHILDTESFGKLAYIQVGAFCVGKIEQTHQGQLFNKGEEMGYFLFGGSTVIILGEPGKWTIDEDILLGTSEGSETFIKLGDRIAKC